MPIYVYTTEDGERVERRFSMKDYPQSIILEDGRVARLTIQAHRPHSSWQVLGTSSDLPPENSSGE